MVADNRIAWKFEFAATLAGANLGDLFCFDYSALVWSVVQSFGSSPSARSGVGMAAIGMQIYVFGGGGLSGGSLGPVVRLVLLLSLQSHILL